ncbi:MAG: hypothetical protein QM658_03925 [Gordonia sp. (in: high G+C Gram-positive bacteria)]
MSGDRPCDRLVFAGQRVVVPGVHGLSLSPAYDSFRHPGSSTDAAPRPGCESGRMSVPQQSPAAADPSTSARKTSTADVVATVVLIFGQAFLALIGVFLTALSALGTDNCGYVECGSEDWIGIAIHTAWIGGAILLVAVLAGATVRANKRRSTWAVAAVGVAAQIVLIVVCLSLSSLAGPV